MKKFLGHVPDNIGQFLRIWLWTALTWICKLLAFTAIVLHFSNLSLGHAVLGTLGAELSSVLPIHGVAGAGTYELAMSAVLLPLGIDVATVLTAAVNLHLYLLGTYWGLICGSALVVDYVLTISISIAAGVDAIFSFLPLEWNSYKLYVAIFAVSVLIWLNMRGIKESIKALAPIFLTFVVTHLFLIIAGIALRNSHITHTLQGVITETNSIIETSGSWTLIVLLLTAYSMGGGYLYWY